MTAPKTELLVCVKCRGGCELAPDAEAPRPGARLLEALEARADDAPPQITIKGVECLSNCSRGCSIALRGADRWSYVYGNLAPEDAEMVLDGAARYAARPDGLVPWRERPEHFRKNCIARIPPLES